MQHKHSQNKQLATTQVFIISDLLEAGLFSSKIWSDHSDDRDLFKILNTQISNGMAYQ